MNDLEVRLIQTIGRVPAFVVLRLLRIGEWFMNTVIAFLILGVIPLIIGTVVAFWVAIGSSRWERWGWRWAIGFILLLIGYYIYEHIAKQWNEYAAKYPAQKKDK